MKHVYMNHRIKQKNPRKPVIVCQNENGKIEADLFEIKIRASGQVIGHVVFDRKGLDACDTHEVKAWVEFNDSVEVNPVGRTVATTLPAKPVATAKEPNKKVKT